MFVLSSRTVILGVTFKVLNGTISILCFLLDNKNEWVEIAIVDDNKIQYLRIKKYNTDLICPTDLAF